MGWVVREPDGSDTPFDTHDEAVAYAEARKARDPRTPEEIWEEADEPRVSWGVFLRRVKMGWDSQRALYTTTDGRFIGPVSSGGVVRLPQGVGGREAVLYEMMGRRRTVAQWSVTSGVSESNIHRGIKKYGSLTAFFLNIGWYPNKPREIDPDWDL